MVPFTVGDEVIDTRLKAHFALAEGNTLEYETAEKALQHERATQLAQTHASGPESKRLPTGCRCLNEDENQLGSKTGCIALEHHQTHREGPQSSVGSITAMKKVGLSLLFTLLNVSLSYAQLDTSTFSYYPCHTGDVRQFRSLYTGMLVFTRFIDSVVLGRSPNQKLVYGHTSEGYPTSEMIDSVGNCYNLLYQPSYVHYKLYADSGNSWQAGVVQDTIPVIATVVGVYASSVFGRATTIKAIRFQYRVPSSGYLFTFGTDYLASGFGLVEEQVEPSDVYYLSGALISGILYGSIASVHNTPPSPATIDLLPSFPNPFNSSTTIAVQVSREICMRLSIHDVAGRLVATLQDGIQEPGLHSYRFDGTGLSSGTYFALLRAGSTSIAHKIVLLK
jgi:hypothetical protein